MAGAATRGPNGQPLAYLHQSAWTAISGRHTMMWAHERRHRGSPTWSQVLGIIVLNTNISLSNRRIGTALNTIHCDALAMTAAPIFLRHIRIATSLETMEQ